MLVRYWMSTRLITLEETDTLLKAAESLRAARIRRLLIVRGPELRGILSQSDLFQFVNPLQFRHVELTHESRVELAARAVRDHMTRTPVTCGPDEALEDVGDLMCRRRVRALPVVRADQLLGIITHTDILRALTRITGAGAGDASKRISARVPSSARTQLFRQIVTLCEKHQLELASILTHTVSGTEQHLVTVRVCGQNCDRLVEELWKTNFQVLQIV
jgi:acetoin utilization protein AcuB